MRKMEHQKNKIISFDVTEAWDDAFQAEHRAFANAIASGKLDGRGVWRRWSLSAICC